MPLQQWQSQWQGTQPRGSPETVTTGAFADAVCELGIFPQAPIQPKHFLKVKLLSSLCFLVNKTRARWLRNKGSLTLSRSCRQYTRVIAAFIYASIWIHSPSLVSTLLLVLLIGRATSNTCLPALFGFMCIYFCGIRCICTVLYKNSLQVDGSFAHTSQPIISDSAIIWLESAFQLTHLLNAFQQLLNY